MVTALCALADLIAFLATVGVLLSLIQSLLAHLTLSQPSGLHLVFNLPLAKLYANSLMSSLNSRAGWKYGNSVGNALHGAIGDSSGRPVSYSGHAEGVVGQPPAFGAHARVSTPRFYKPSLRTTCDDDGSYHELPSSSLAGSTALRVHNRYRDSVNQTGRSMSL